MNLFIFISFQIENLLFSSENGGGGEGSRFFSGHKKGWWDYGFTVEG